MPGARYNAIPREYWSALGPAFKGLSDDLAAVETNGGGGGGGNGVLTSGPYVLDPKRTPAGQVALIPAGTPVLTHIGNRWTGTPAGTTPTDPTQLLAGTMRFGTPTTGTSTYADVGLFGESVQIATSATAGDIAQIASTLPTGITEVAVSMVMVIPEPAGADCRVVQLIRTSGNEIGAIIKPGSVAGKVNVVFDDAKTSGSWNYVSPDITAGTRIRVAFTAKIGTGSDGAMKAAAWVVNNDGSETQIGVTYEVTGATTPATDVYTTLAFGKLTGNAGLTGKTLQLDAVRVAYGAGAYSVGLLRDERLYPAAV